MSEPVTTRGVGIASTIRSTIYKQGSRNLIKNLKDGGGYEGVIEPIIAASRGRNPDKPSDRSRGIDTKQFLEPNCGGVSNTLTSVRKDNLVIEGSEDLKDKPKAGTIIFNGKRCRIRKLTPLECYRLMGFADSDFIKAATLDPSDENAENIIGISEMFGQSITGLLADRNKKATMSNSQLYRQAGNSIVVDVFTHLLKSVKAAVPSAFDDDERGKEC